MFRLNSKQWLALAALLVGLLGLDLLLSYERYSRWRVCTVCHLYSKQIRYSLRSWGIGEIGRAEELRANDCSEWVAQHEPTPHAHHWVWCLDFYTWGFLERGAGSGIHTSTFPHITAAEQLAIYQKCENAEAFTAAQNLFRQFQNHDSNNQPQRELEWKISEQLEKLSALKTIKAADLQVP